ncbi:uncharacterized protein apof [Xyrauchen texanus]|uniref:uncharacterized protein apof n=1 Tax=Xyrauchen texanus TaxID=154827 RepID=UPI0022423141|nr:uncharacterized protein apof [Xyrauchen texanus]
MAKWNSNLKWLLLVHLLLTDVVFARAPLGKYHLFGLQRSLRPVTEKTFSSQSFLSESQNEPGIMFISKEAEQVESPVVSDEEPGLQQAHQLVLDLSALLQGQLHLKSNTSCPELAAGGWKGNEFSQELLGLAMVPVLVSAGCLFEAQALVMKLYTVLGQDDTRELLQDILVLIKRGKEKEENHIGNHTFRNATQTPFPPSMLSSETQRHLLAVMFNIHQLAEVGERADGYNGKGGPRGQCKGWIRVKGTELLGQTADQIGTLHLEEAQQACRSLGLHCAGVTQDGSSSSGSYSVIIRPGSRVVPSSSSESWIQSCRNGPVRWRRNAVPQCANEKEERVYTVVEWIPAVSTLYNLGTAVYYASVNCYETAKERAILSTVDLGTDALMAVTGGTAGVAGYALGAGLKTGVKAGIKYLLNSIKQEEDLQMNQNSWEDGTLSIQ